MYILEQLFFVSYIHLVHPILTRSYSYVPPFSTPLHTLLEEVHHPLLTPSYLHFPLHHPPPHDVDSSPPHPSRKSLLLLLTS